MAHIDKFVLPVTDEMLTSFNFFELYPIDGGGSMFFNELLGTLNDMEIADKIINQNILGNFGELPQIDYRKYEYWRTVEKSCWINRWYFIASLAHAYWLKGNEKLAELVKECILYLIRNYTPPQGKEEIGKHWNYVCHLRDDEYNMRSMEENYQDETDIQYMWFDFQVASRLIHMIYALYFLKGSTLISTAEIDEIENSVYKHAELIYIAEKYYAKLKSGDNHQSIRGVALLFAGSYFKEVGDWEQFIEEGVRISNFHIQDAFLSDGMLGWISPSYHCFQLWHMRDALFLAKQYDFELYDGAEEILKNATAATSAIIQPDGYSVSLNDAFPVNLAPILASLPHKADVNNDSAVTHYFPKAGIASYQNEQRYLLFDASRFTGQRSHYHAGKNALTYWYKNKPFLVDSGCCNYDDTRFLNWYKQAKAHSSMMVDGEGDGFAAGICNWENNAEPSLGDWINSDGQYSISTLLKSSSPAWQGVTWKRSLIITEDVIYIKDQVKTETKKKLQFRFILHPDVTVQQRDSSFLIENGNTQLNVSFSAMETNLSAAIEKGVCCINFEHIESFVITISAEEEGELFLTSKIEQIKF
jgi:Heparinase II/III-like protein/Heparinase II/III N-terminus